MAVAQEELRRFQVAMRRLRLGFVRIIGKAMSKFDLTVPQYTVLFVLFYREKCKMSELARELGITMGAATSLVDRLIKGGLVKRQRSPEDRRVVLVSLSKKGKRTVEEGHELTLDLMSRLLSRLSAKEREAFLMAYEKMSQEIENL
jgi:DNA-binding MarR family transcriptional regulator